MCPRWVNRRRISVLRDWRLKIVTSLFPLLSSDSFSAMLRCRRRFSTRFQALCRAQFRSHPPPVSRSGHNANYHPHLISRAINRSQSQPISSIIILFSKSHLSSSSSASLSKFCRTSQKKEVFRVSFPRFLLNSSFGLQPPASEAP